MADVILMLLMAQETYTYKRWGYVINIFLVFLETRKLRPFSSNLGMRPKKRKKKKEKVK